ncbi:MAG: PEGA domain-containing protein [Candidatus Alcyoniella australis]|nr:PEGA domain-containing protein [Candidatus Alcyoniella australis]
MYRSLAVALILILALAGTALAAVSIEDAVGQFLFAGNVGSDYQYGFIEFSADHEYVWVIHVDTDHDQLEDRYEVRRGSYEVRRNAQGEPGLYLLPQGGEPGFLEQTDFSGLRLSAFTYEGFSFHRRRPADSLFDMSGDQPELSGQLEVISVPPGAAIWLDGKRVPGSTPLTIESTSAGVEHTLRAELVDHQPQLTTFTLKPNQRKRIEVKLASGKATFALKTEPVVKVWMDGRFIGATPMWREDIEAGLHSVELRNDALGIRESFEVQIEEGRVWKKVMRWEGTIELRSDVQCNVFLDDEQLGVTPLSVKLPVGVHRLELRPPDEHHGRRLFVTIKLDQATSLDVIYQDLDR